METPELTAMVNDFAIRSFRDVADDDYIAARMALRATLVPQFLWSSLQAIEKYLKAILLLNRTPSTTATHGVSALLTKVASIGKLKFRISAATGEFVDYLATFLYDPKAHVLTITKVLIPPHTSPVMHQTGRISSIPDLAGSQLAVMLEDFSGSPATAEEISRLRDALKLAGLSMNVKNRLFNLSAVNQVRRKFRASKITYSRSQMGWFTTLPNDIAKFEIAPR